MGNKEKLLWTAAFFTVGFVGCKDTPAPTTTQMYPSELPPSIPDGPKLSVTSQTQETAPISQGTIYENPPQVFSSPHPNLHSREVTINSTSELTIPPSRTKYPDKEQAQTIIYPPGFPTAVIKLEPYLRNAANEHEVDLSLVASVIATESGGIIATSLDGAQGVMQVMPEHFTNEENPNDLETNIDRGVEILGSQLVATGENIQAALAGYNAGPAARNWLMAPQEEYEERKLRFIEIFAQYLIENREYETERAYEEATHKAWEVEKFISEVMYWYTQFGN